VIRDVYLDNILRERWDDGARVFTAWNTSGAQTTQRPYTTAENLDADARASSEAARTNDATLRQRAANAIQGNKDFLALTAPTNAQIVAQVKALTRQNNALIPLVLGVTASTDTSAAIAPA
jgi:hypothetical protein